MAKLIPLESEIPYRDMAQQLGPVGPIWSLNNPGVAGMRGGEAVEATRFHNRLVDLMREAFPATADELLSQWESDFGLPLCDDAPTTLEARQAALAGKVAAQGGQSRAYYTDLAWTVLETEGFVRAIDPEFVWIEERPHGSPFRVSINRVGDRLGSVGDLFAWVMHLPSQLSEDGAHVLECLIEHYKPAHTTVSFEYDSDMGEEGP